MTGNKSELRAEAKARRRGRASIEPSSLLDDFLHQSLMPHAKVGLFYNKMGEISTNSLLNTLAKRYEVYAPVVIADDLVWRKVDGNIKLGKFNISEPTSSEEVIVSELSCILLPALAVDLAGNRLGFGAGYFDRSLQNTASIKIALVFDQDIVAKIDAEKHDIRVDFIATETRLIKISD